MIKVKNLTKKFKINKKNKKEIKTAFELIFVK